MNINPEVFGKVLTREEINNLSLPDKDKQLAFAALDAGADVILAGETDDRYTFNYLFSPKGNQNGK